MLYLHTFNIYVIFFRENLAQVIRVGQGVIDNPVYISDLGAALTTGEPAELQQVLEETNVSIRDQFFKINDVVS